MMKKIFKLLLIILVIFTISVLSISHIIDKNEDYLVSLASEIKENYSIDEDITYVNTYGNYYIITTSTSVIVLTKDYDEVLKESLSSLASNPDDYALIYKTNTLMYENTTTKDDELTYEYYNAKTGELISTTTMEKK